MSLLNDEFIELWVYRIMSLSNYEFIELWVCQIIEFVKLRV